jgi:dTDP-4-dehydrorhamnose 3,5-epimerase
MRFEPLTIHGAMKISIEAYSDARGFFARLFCAKEFAAHDLPVEAVQASMSYNATRGTVRGLHFQMPPSREGKLVRCLRGAAYDVLLDLRPKSPSYLTHVALQLDDSNRDAVFIPHGVAHGFQTLADKTEMMYQMTDWFAPDLAVGFRWNDPAFAIRWPLPVSCIAERDAAYPDFDRDRFETEISARQRKRSGRRP